MSSGLRNIALILTLAVLLPVAIFTVVEISSLNQNEKMLEQVYREQLDGIIFSINQYGADLFDFYIQQVDYTYTQSGIEGLQQPDAITGNLAIEYLFIQEDTKITQINLNRPDKRKVLNADSIFKSNQLLTERLIRYKSADYIKQEILGTFQLDGQKLQLNLIIIGEDTPCLVIFKPVTFIEDLLAPKIQQITTQVINVAINDTLANDLVYQSAAPPSGIIQAGRLLNMPGYLLEVSLEATSVTDLIAYRTKRNLIALSVMVAIIILGLVLIFRNLRREMQLNKAKADFVANVSHEIRTPLALISMFNETLLLGRVKEGKKMEYYDIISKETARLKNIINKILSFSQMDANRKTYKRVSFKPDQKVSEILHSYSYHLKEKGFTYQLDLNGDATIEADEEAFEEVIINLIDNAVKYSKENKHIDLTSKIDTNSYLLSIADKGIGIAAKHQKHIFEKFYRVDGGDIHTTKGTGLGLSLVSEIVTAHGGSIELQSKTDAGSTFTVKIPLA